MVIRLFRQLAIHFVMKLSDFDYYLPPELIAQHPVEPRDHSRLLVMDKKTGKADQKKFYEISNYLKPGDLLILNDSKVIPARLIGKKELTGGKAEILLLSEIEPGLWQCLGKKVKDNARIIFDSSKLIAAINEQDGEIYKVRFNMSGPIFLAEIEKIGLVPIPPYIRAGINDSKDKTDYQTVYARSAGSVAAPTAGLHFTTELLEKIRKNGVGIEYLTLHVGLGTFAKVKSDKITDHKMHSEFFEIPLDLIEKIKSVKKSDGRIIAVGTTTARVLETIFGDTKDYGLKTSNCISGWADIFIYPGYKFKCIDSLITNFHLPKSTLLMLVSAFAGKKSVDRAYKIAIENKYRFYSYGDAMFITDL